MLLLLCLDHYDVTNIVIVVVVPRSLRCHIGYDILLRLRAAFPLLLRCKAAVDGIKVEGQQDGEEQDVVHHAGLPRSGRSRVNHCRSRAQTNQQSVSVRRVGSVMRWRANTLVCIPSCCFDCPGLDTLPTPAHRCRALLLPQAVCAPLRYAPRRWPSSRRLR